MAWNISTIGKWHDFVDLIDGLPSREFVNMNWFFRGQANADWPLVPSLLRHIDCSSITHQKACGIEHGAFRRFFEQANLHLRIENTTLASPPFTWWILMQHYSCPTRMLDWSLSPYVAAYFAVEQFFDRDGAIWIFPASRLDALMTHRYGAFRDLAPNVFETGDLNAIYPILGIKQTERSAAQQGVYTLPTNICANHGDIMAGIFEEAAEQSSLHKILIPTSLKLEFLSQLRLMNITAAALFPGLDGLGRSASEYVRLSAGEQ